MSKKTVWLALLLITVICMLFGFGCAADQDSAEPDQGDDNGLAEGEFDPEEYFKGEVVKLITPHSVGGGFDTYARTMAKYLDEIVPATVIVENVHGGGGNVGRNQIFRADPDGYAIGFSGFTGMIFSELSGVEGIQYESAEFTLLARVGFEPRAISVATDSEFETIEDLINADREIVFSASGVGSDDYFAGNIACDVLGIDSRFITAFEGSGEQVFAVIQGDVDAHTASFSTHEPHYKTGELKPLLFISQERLPDYPDVPTILELVESGSEEETILQALVNSFEAERVVFGPPNMPEEITAYYRNAFETIFSNPDFVNELDRIGRPVQYMDGGQLEVLVDDVAVVGEQYLKEMLRSYN